MILILWARGALRALVLPLVMAGLLAGCAGGPQPTTTAWRAPPPHRTYRAPGPPGDPWGPYVREASQRFGVPERWVREVMRQESGGNRNADRALATSPVGAIGLMQVMPATYDDLRVRHGLGGDPYDPHNNILAGAAYLRDMYKEFGSPTFLAAYNAGPIRVNDYLAGLAPLPRETRNYVAAIAPRLNGTVRMTGPLASLAGPHDAAPKVIAAHYRYVAPAREVSAREAAACRHAAARGRSCATAPRRA